ncbi:MAG: family 1 glycosylhydrolase [Chloroflexi bacterium]|nr:family 1 glycosylhydrolase [Chloroflexota bacterium]
MPEPRRFPPGFLWGTATAAHQVEGGNQQNQWAQWERRPGRIRAGDTAGDACGWWRSASRDLALAAELGTNAHRLSLEWSRIEPVDGRFDAAAIERYRELLGELRSLGIRPMVTLHHFTHPLWFDAQGAWAAADAVERFTRYVNYTVAALCDLCDLWVTINEPTIFAVQGYLAGVWPPGRRSAPETLATIATLTRAHAAAADAIHRIDSGLQVGLAHHIRLMDPASRHPLDRLLTGVLDRALNLALLDALRTGHLALPYGVGQRIAGLRGSCDFIGINYYTRDHVAFDPRAPQAFFARRFVPAGAPVSAATHDGTPYGEVYPQGVARAIAMAARVGLPLYLTEVGMPDRDDLQRPEMLLATLGAVHRMIGAGHDVRGVFWWTLVDNFEWAEGWQLPFGLIALDRASGTRRVRRSGALYAAVARANALPAANERGVE